MLTVISVFTYKLNIGPVSHVFTDLLAFARVKYVTLGVGPRSLAPGLYLFTLGVVPPWCLFLERRPRTPIVRSAVRRGSVRLYRAPLHHASAGYFVGRKNMFDEFLHAKLCRIIWKLHQKVSLGPEICKIGPKF